MLRNDGAENVDPGVLTFNSARINSPSEMRTRRPADKLAFGDFEIAVSGVGGQSQLTVRDQQSPFVKQFRGSLWFPVNTSYRVHGTHTLHL